MVAYQIVVRDRTGSRVHVTDRFRSFSIEHMVNHVSNLQLSVAEDDPIARYLDQTDANLDNLIEVRRTAPEFGIGWYTEFIGFHRTAQRQVTSTDLKILTSFSRGLLDLIKRRSIRHYADTLGSTKGPLPADDVIKLYVDENAGSFATAGGGPTPGRVTDGVTPGLTVAAAALTGPIYEGAHAWKNLLVAIQEIGAANDVDFDVVWGGASAPATFEFRTYYPRIGTDRTLGSSSGAEPVIFGIAYGNMQSPSHTRSRTEEVSSALVLGPGEGPLRDTTLRVSDHTANSPWNLIEEDINASQEDRLVALNKIGDGLLYEKRPAVSFTFDVLQTLQAAYRRHYFLGDLVTARYDTDVDNLKIVSIRLTVSEDDAETVHLGLEEVG